MGKECGEVYKAVRGKVKKVMERNKDKILVTRSSLPPMEEYIREIKDIWETHWMTNMGEKHQRLEKELKQYLNVSNLQLFSNGHMALELVIQAMGLRGEVITTPFTFASTTHAIVRNGLTPVFCDIDKDNYVIDAEKIEDLITERTSAILPVHVYGNICDIEKIADIADRHDLKVIYDAAHAFGVTYKGKGIGSFGDASMFSFHATKVFNTIEGGAICYKEENLGNKLYQLKNFGIKDEITVNGVGANAKMNEFQAAMGLCNLVHIEEEIEKRRQVYCKYTEFLQGIPGIILPKLQENVKYNYSYFPICVDAEKYGNSREQLCKYLQEKNIFSRKYFYPLTNQFECYKDIFDAEKTPIAKEITEKILVLPLYAGLSMSVIETICHIIKEKSR